MRSISLFNAILFLGCAALILPQHAQAQFYFEDFITSDGLVGAGWDGSSTEFSGAFDNGAGLSNEADTLDGIDGGGGVGGVVWHWHSNVGVEAIWTTEFDPIDPNSGDIHMSWGQTENAQGVDVNVQVHPAMMVGGAWYAWSTPFETNDEVRDPWQLLDIGYTPVAANWMELTLNGDGSAAFGGTPASNLSGNIEGVGFASFAPNVTATTETVHYDYVQLGIPPFPGDVDGDKEVTLLDLEIIRGAFNENVAGRSEGDLTGDGVVDFGDFRQWKNNYPDAATAAGATIPEPTTALLALLGVLLGWRAPRFCRATADSHWNR